MLKNTKTFVFLTIEASFLFFGLIPFIHIQVPGAPFCLIRANVQPL
jgi:hypothetical protein